MNAAQLHEERRRKARHVAEYLHRYYFDGHRGQWNDFGARDAYFLICELHKFRRRG